MKKKSTSQSAPARRSPWLAVLSGRSFPGHAPASATGIAKAEVFTRRRLGEGGFFNLRVLIATVFCLAGIFFALTGAGLYLGSSKAQAQSGPASTMPVTANSPNAPDVVQLVGPVRLDQDLRSRTADATFVSVVRRPSKIGDLCLPAVPVGVGKNLSPGADHAAAAAAI